MFSSTTCIFFSLELIFVDSKSGLKNDINKLTLYVIIMSRTRFRANLHFIVAWISRNSLLLTQSLFVYELSGCGFESCCYHLNINVVKSKLAELFTTYSSQLFCAIFKRNKKPFDKIKQNSGYLLYFRLSSYFSSKLFSFSINKGKLNWSSV